MAVRNNFEISEAHHLGSLLWTGPPMPDEYITCFGYLIYLIYLS